MKHYVDRLKKLVSLLLSLAMILSLAVGFSGCGKTVNLGDYITINVEGYNGAGKASYHVDYSKLCEDTDLHQKMEKLFQKHSGDLKETFGEDAVLVKNLISSFDDSDIGHFFLDEILKLDYSFSQQEGLSNGDEVVLNISSNETKLEGAEKELGIKLKVPASVSRTIGADELPKATEIDVSSYIEKVTFKGPEGACVMKLGIANQQTTVGGFAVKTSSKDKTLTVTKDGHTDTYRYEIVKLNGEEEFGDIATDNYSWSDPQTYYSLKNGDTLAVGVKDLPDAEAGYVLTNRETDVTVKGLKPLIKSAEEVPMASLKADASKQLAKSTYFHKEKLSFKFFYQLDSSAEHINRILVRADGTYGNNDAMWLVIYDDVYEEDGTLKYNKDPEIVEMENFDFAPKDFNKEFQKYLDTDSYKITDLK